MRVEVHVDDVESLTQQDERGISKGDVVAYRDKVAIVKDFNVRTNYLSVEPVNTTRAALDKAVKRFSGFTGMEPGAVESVPVSGPGVAFLVGTLDAVEYTTVRDGKRESYRHDFRKAARPLLAIGNDGRQLLVLSGAYRFTDEGITDEA